MTIYDELVARGLVAQVTDEAEIKELINKYHHSLTGAFPKFDKPLHLALKTGGVMVNIFPGQHLSHIGSAGTTNWWPEALLLK